MSANTERGGCRFVVGKSDDGQPVIKLELFHDTVPALKTLSVGLEPLSGTTLQQATALVDAINERIIGVIVTPK